jgi:hypothetical protein
VRDSPVASRCPASRSVTLRLCSSRMVMGRVVAEAGGCARRDRAPGCLEMERGASSVPQFREPDRG